MPWPAAHRMLVPSWSSWARNLSRSPPPVCGDASLRAGCVEEAHRLAQRALADARHRKMRGWEAWAQWLLGEIVMHRDPPDVTPAETHYHQALALATELGMRPLQAHCHLGLGTLYATAGQWEQAAPPWPPPSTSTAPWR